MRRPRFLAAAVLAAAALSQAAWAQPAARGAASAPVFGSVPVQREPATAMVDWLPQFASAAIVLVALAWAWQWRRTRLPSPATFGGTMRSVSALRLTPQATLHVVQWGEEQLLLACSNAGVVVVARRPLAAAPGAQP